MSSSQQRSTRRRRLCSTRDIMHSRKNFMCANWIYENGSALNQWGFISNWTKSKRKFCYFVCLCSCSISLLIRLKSCVCHVDRGVGERIIWPQPIPENIEWKGSGVMISQAEILSVKSSTQNISEDQTTELNNWILNYVNGRKWESCIWPPLPRHTFALLLVLSVNLSHIMTSCHDHEFLFEFFCAELKPQIITSLILLTFGTIFDPSLSLSFSIAFHFFTLLDLYRVRLK